MGDFGWDARRRQVQHSFAILPKLAQPRMLRWDFGRRSGIFSTASGGLKDGLGEGRELE